MESLDPRPCRGVQRAQLWGSCLSRAKTGAFRSVGGACVTQFCMAHSNAKKIKDRLFRLPDHRQTPTTAC